MERRGDCHVKVAQTGGTFKQHFAPLEHGSCYLRTGENSSMLVVMHVAAWMEGELASVGAEQLTLGVEGGWPYMHSRR